MSEDLKDKDLDTLRVEILDRLDVMGNNPDVDETNLNSLGASIIAVINQRYPKWDEATMLNLMIDYKNGLGTGFSNDIIKLLYKADGTNKNKLILAFPLEGLAFEKYGRTPLFGLELALKEMNNG